MSIHRVELEWVNKSPKFIYEAYDRNHSVKFESGLQVEISAAKQYLGDPKHPDPEQLFAASLSSCHMLTFLALAAKSRFFVHSYSDNAEAHLETGESGKPQVSLVVLNPRVKMGGSTQLQFEKLHQKAHENCFIARAVSCSLDIRAELV